MYRFWGEKKEMSLLNGRQRQIRLPTVDIVDTSHNVHVKSTERVSSVAVQRFQLLHQRPLRQIRWEGTDPQAISTERFTTHHALRVGRREQRTSSGRQRKWRRTHVQHERRLSQQIARQRSNGLGRTDRQPPRAFNNILRPVAGVAQQLDRLRRVASNESNGVGQRRRHRPQRPPRFRVLGQRSALRRPARAATRVPLHRQRPSGAPFGRSSERLFHRFEKGIVLINLLSGPIVLELAGTNNRFSGHRLPLPGGQQPLRPLTRICSRRGCCPPGSGRRCPLNRLFVPASTGTIGPLSTLMKMIPFSNR